MTFINGLTGQRKDWFIRIKRKRDLGELEGRCPECHEYTTAGDSCCGRGAIVEGSHISDDEAQDAQAERELEKV